MKAAFTLSTVIAMSLLISFAGFSQARSSASASASSDGPMDLTIGTFVFSAGEYVALEIVRDEDCFCMCDPIEVLDLNIEGTDGSVAVNVISAHEFPVLIDEWTGMLALSTPEGDPLPSGQYTVVVRTSVGSFRALLHIIEPGAPKPIGRVSSMASICDIELRIYRLLTEHTYQSISLQTGDCLMVALEGNATTGYCWQPISQEHQSTLTFLAGRDYQPSPSPIGVVGSGGKFLFRYKAELAGKAELGFRYSRSWETGSETDGIIFQVTVW